MATFNPAELLKQKIVDNISSIQVLIFGNTDEQSAVEFCKENIVQKFNIAPDARPIGLSVPLKAACIYHQDSKLYTNPPPVHNGEITSYSSLYRSGHLGEIKWDCNADGTIGQEEEKQPNAEA